MYLFFNFENSRYLNYICGFCLINYYFSLEDSGEEIERLAVGSQGPKIKPFSELGAIQKRRVTQPVVDSLRSLAEGRLIDPVRLSGYILKRYIP